MLVAGPIPARRLPAPRLSSAQDAPRHAWSKVALCCRLAAVMQAVAFPRRAKLLLSMAPSTIACYFYYIFDATSDGFASPPLKLALRAEDGAQPRQAEASVIRKRRRRLSTGAAFITRCYRMPLPQLAIHGRLFFQYHRPCRYRHSLLADSG